MATFGKLEEYDNKEPWLSYTERVDAFFNANGIEDDEKKKWIFLSTVGTSTYATLRSLLAPAKPKEKKYKELMATLSSHFSPPPSEIAESFRFNTRVQLENESVATFVAELRQMAEHCNFGAALNRMLRDRLVCGIRDKTVQQRLLVEKNLTLEKAVEISRSAEAAERNATEIQRGHVDATTSGNQEGTTNHLKFHRKKNGQQGPKGQKWKDPKATAKKKPGPQDKASACIRCGFRDHKSPDCPHINTKCYKCEKVGHLASCCLSKTDKPKKQSTKQVNVLESVGEPSEYYLHALQAKSTVKPITVTFMVNGLPIEMELDSGSPVSLISEDTYLSHQRSLPRPAETDIKLKCIRGPIPVQGTLTVDVSLGETKSQQTLLVVSCKSPNLCGRDWMAAFDLLPRQVNSTQLGETATDRGVRETLQEFEEVFKPGCGAFKGPPVHVDVLPDAQPRYYRARSVPYALRDKVELELQRLEEEGIITAIDHSDWASPIVPVLKADGKSVRICGDYKLGVNPAVMTTQYPLPKVEDIFASLQGGVKFSKLDFREAYNQLLVDKETSKLLVINTHRGLFAYNRLAFGVSSAPALFQRRMEETLQGIPGTSVYLDDVLVTGKTDAEHLENLRKVLQKVKDSGLKLKREKCEFFKESLCYLGHEINAEGLKPSKKNAEAIIEAPEPRDVSELRSYIGLLSYYGKFIPNLSTVLAPLYALLHKNTRWQWTDTERKAFVESKNAIMEARVLTHYDPSKELVLACDASPYGVGAVLSHRKDGVESPLAFASRTLTPAERNYSQLEKEALAIIFGVTRYRDYLLCRSFVLITDHKPLVGIFREDKAIPAMTASRIQRWALTLGAYRYSIEHRPGRLNGNADAMSRLPLKTAHTDPPEPPELVNSISSLEKLEISVKQLQQFTSSDKDLSQVLQWVEEGWPQKPPDKSLQPFWNRRDELSVHRNLLYWGNRVVVPTPARQHILDLLHETHQGMVVMKGMARSLVWWPNMDAEVERCSRQCSQCLQNSPMPPKAEPVPWPEPKECWERLHLDYAGPFEGKMLLVLVDAKSKWLEVIIVASATSEQTVEHLRDIFARFGLPRCIVTDNGTPFTGQPFQDFVQGNGIKHLRTAPFHPASNGLAERAVRTVKDGLKKTEGRDLKLRLAQWLLMYRRAPRPNGTSPAKQMLAYRMKARLDLCIPRKGEEAILEQLPTESRQRAEQEEKEKGLRHKKGNKVAVRNFGKGARWWLGEVENTSGASIVTVSTPQGQVRRHIDQVKPHLTALASSPKKQLPPDQDQGCTTSDARSAESSRTPNMRRPTRTVRKPLRFT